MLHPIGLKLMFSLMSPHLSSAPLILQFWAMHPSNANPGLQLGQLKIQRSLKQESAAHLCPVSRGDGEGLDEGPPMSEKKGGLSTGIEGPS